MRIALVHNFATRVSTLESGGKISGEPLAPLFNSDHGGNNDKGEGNEATVKGGSTKNILDTGGETDEKYESDFKDKGHSQIFVLQTAHKQALQMRFHAQSISYLTHDNGEKKSTLSLP